MWLSFLRPQLDPLIGPPYTRQVATTISRRNRIFSGVRGCWLGFASLILSFAGCSEWMDVSRKERSSDAEYVLALEKGGKLQEAVRNGRVSEHAAKTIDEYRRKHGPIKYFRVVRSFGYPTGLGHGGAAAVIVRGDRVFELSTMSENGRVFGWWEQPEEVSSGETKSDH